MSYNISELDKNKTEQCIANETIRLDNCKVTLDRLKNEWCDKQYEYMTKLGDMKRKIYELEDSITDGEKFIEECKNHLKTFES